MITRSPSYQRGFTLIELLMVISIISLISSVIFSITYGVRIKATNAQIIAQTKEVEKTFQLEKDSQITGFVDTGDDSTYYCMGKTSSESCRFWGTDISGNDTLKTASSKYLQPFTVKSVTIDGLDYSGIIYKCAQRTEQGCTGAAIYWVQANTDTCTSGQLVVAGVGGVVCGQDADGSGTVHVEAEPEETEEWSVLDSRCPASYTYQSWDLRTDPPIQYYACTAPENPQTLFTPECIAGWSSPEGSSTSWTCHLTPDDAQQAPPPLPSPKS